jgi:acetyl-CoA carboxylase alpha subunit
MDASPVKKTQEKAKEKAKEKVKEKEKKEKIKKIRTLCKLVKRDFLKKNFKEYQELVTDPHFICRKCGRVAKEKQYLCKPVLILMEVKEKDSITLQGKEIELLQENEPKLSEEKL